VGERRRVEEEKKIRRQGIQIQPTMSFIYPNYPWPIRAKRRIKKKEARSERGKKGEKKEEATGIPGAMDAPEIFQPDLTLLLRIRLRRPYDHPRASLLPGEGKRRGLLDPRKGERGEERRLDERIFSANPVRYLNFDPSVTRCCSAPTFR